MREDCARLERQQQQLTEELDGPQLSVPQQREMLLQKVKADNAEIAEAERHLAEMQEAVRRGRAQLSQLATDMSEVRDARDSPPCPRTAVPSLARRRAVAAGRPTTRRRRSTRSCSSATRR
jgi:uncharacterized protein YhaN